MSRNNE